MLFYYAFYNVVLTDSDYFLSVDIINENYYKHGIKWI